MASIIHSVVHIQNNYVEYMETFATKTRARKVFEFMIQEKFPLLTTSGLREAVKQQMFGNNENTESFHIIDHKIS